MRHFGELSSLSSSQNIIRMRGGEVRNAYKILVYKPLRRPRRIWKDNIKVDLMEVVFGVGSSGS
jgi:hypothetical protein